MTTLSADADLNQDPANFSYNVGFVLSDGFGTPTNGPDDASCMWSLRVDLNNIGQAPHTVWPGNMMFENLNGRWVRSVTRDYTDGSTSYGSWVQLFGAQYVKSVNSATGAITIGLSVS
jgi:hypothetical protein